MRIRTIALVFAAAFLSTAISARSLAVDRAVSKAGLQDDMENLWDDLGRRLQEMGNRWRERWSPTEGRGERPLITFMLRHREQLGLTRDQVQGLEKLRNDFEKDAIKFDADLRIAEMDLTGLLNADPVDLTKAEAKIREIERIKADLRIARVRAIEKGKGLLTAEQRAKLTSLLGDSQFSRLRFKD